MGGIRGYGQVVVVTRESSNMHQLPQAETVHINTFKCVDGSFGRTLMAAQAAPTLVETVPHTGVDALAEMLVGEAIQRLERSEI